MRRLLDDPELPLALRQDLQRSRSAGQDYAASEKLLQLRAALVDRSRQAHWAGQLAGRLAHPGWKLMLVLSMVGAGGVALRMLDGAEREQGALVTQPPAARVVAAEASAEAVPSAIVGPAPATPSQPVTAASESARIQGSDPAAPDVRARAARAENRAERARAAAASSSSRREIAQLVRIRALLDRDPAAAYRLAQRSEQEFPAGLLSEERQALAILALAKTGELTEARRKANAFVARYPQGPMRAQIEAAFER